MFEPCPSPAVRADVPLFDWQSLHTALARAERVLDVLEICEAATEDHGGGLWTSACGRPNPRCYVFGSRPVIDPVLQSMVAAIELELGESCPEDAQEFVKSVIARWRFPERDSIDDLPGEYVQVNLSAAGQFYGVMRITRTPSHSPESYNWGIVEQVANIAMPYVCLAVQKEAEATRIDPLTGLWTQAELRQRVDLEVERARNYPVEFSLVVMSLRMGSARSNNVLNERELKAVGQVLIDTLRSSDWAGRLEDGRVAVLLPMTNQRNSLIALSRVMDRLRAHPDLPSDLECQTGMSGWTFEGSSGPELFQQATSALESAQSAGARGAFVFL